MDSKLSNLLLFGLIAAAIAAFVIAKVNHPKAQLPPVIQSQTTEVILSQEIRNYIDSKFVASATDGKDTLGSALNKIAALESQIHDLTNLAQQIEDDNKKWRDNVKKRAAEREKIHSTTMESDREAEVNRLKAAVLKECSQRPHEEAPKSTPSPAPPSDNTENSQ